MSSTNGSFKQSLTNTKIINSSDHHSVDPTKNSKKQKLSSPPSSGITNQNFKVKY